jgi:starvation-inducible outer membrane lipoprotein
MRRNLPGAVALILALAGCGPLISASLQRQAGPPVNFAAVQAHPEQYQGKVVILGGEVASVWVKNGSSLLTVNEQPLTPDLRPVEGSSFGGTFWVESDKWLSPSEYVPNRKVTVAGEVLGRRDGTLLLKAREIHLWEHPLQLIAVPPSYYDYDKTLEYWFTPPYFNPYVTGR